MKERPILMAEFSVRGILDDRKGQTRRVAKFMPYHEGGNLDFSGLVPGYYFTDVPSSGWVLRSRGAGGCWNDRTKPLFCPYGQPGDRLWVKETHGWVTGNGVRTVYRADGEPKRSDGSIIAGMKWRPSIFMKRSDSRITLEITEVRVERLQEISEADAQREGVQRTDEGERGGWLDYTGRGPWDRAKNSFLSLWESINGEGSWGANPWVWVIGFRRVDA